MKKYSLAFAAFTTAALLTGTVTLAQDDKQNDPKDKLRQYDEIIIRKKTDKDSKVTIEIKNGNIFVDGKPLDDYDNDNLSVRKGGLRHFEPGSPFREPLVRPYRQYQFHLDQGAGKDQAFLGVATEEAPGGARITSLNENSAASKAGLKKGDIIAKIDKETIRTHEDVVKAVRAHKPGDKLSITYRRDDKEHTANVTLGKTKAEAFSFQGPNGGGTFAMPELRDFRLDLGDRFDQFYDRMGRGRLGIRAQDTEDGKGVKVLDVTDESIAEKAGIKEEDVITEFDGKTVNSADQLAEAAQDARDKASVTVKLLRDGKSQTVELKTPKKLKTATL